MSKSLSNHLTKIAVQALGSLPEWLQRKIGGGHLNLQNHTLCPEVSMFLRLMGDIDAASPQNHPIEKVRAQTDLDAWIFGGRQIKLHKILDFSISAIGNEIPARYYEGSKNSKGILLYFHGGAWVSGSLNSCDSICRYLAKHADIKVISVDYRLAPEHAYPAGVSDAYEAYKFVLHELKAKQDNQFVAVGGDSAGGNIAASLCQQLDSEKLPMPNYQVLLYPVLDTLNKSNSYTLFKSGYVLTEAQMDWAKALYSPTGGFENPYISPVLAPSLKGLPPAYVTTAEFDVLRDEGERYAAKLTLSSPATQMRRAPGLIHGFANMTGVSRTARAEMKRVAEALKTARSNWLPQK